MRDTKPKCDLRWILRILSDTESNTEPADLQAEKDSYSSAVTVLLTVCNATVGDDNILQVWHSITWPPDLRENKNLNCLFFHISQHILQTPISTYALGKTQVQQFLARSISCTTEELEEHSMWHIMELSFNYINQSILQLEYCKHCKKKITFPVQLSVWVKTGNYPNASFDRGMPQPIAFYLNLALRSNTSISFWIKMQLLVWELPGSFPFV